MDIEGGSDHCSSQEIVTSVRPTIFESAVVLSTKQLEEHWDFFPKSVQQSLKKAAAGQLPGVTDSDLQQKIQQYQRK